LSKTVDLAIWDFASPEFQDDPYPVYAALREHGAVTRIEREDFVSDWVTHHEVVSGLLRDDRFVAVQVPEDMVAEGVPDAFRRLGELLSHMMLLTNPPDHTRLRGLVNKAFTPRVVENLRPRIETIVAELIAAVHRDGRADVMSDFATPLPVAVIAELMGIPATDLDRFKDWSDKIAVVLDGSIRGAGLPAAAQAGAELADYLRDIVRKRRVSPREDLLTRLVQARERDDALTEEELIATAILILLAGHETTTNLIGNGILALADHPEEWRKLCEAPEGVVAAVEEVLRWDGPVQLTTRGVSEPVELYGWRFEPGIEVNLSFGAAGRDPLQFPDADRFDIQRSPNRHLAFGMGAHFCLGAPLARLEAQVLFRALAERMPAFKIDRAGVQRRPGLVLRGLGSLPIEF
jgi:cytochrome P450